MGGGGPWEPRNKVAELSWNKLDYLNKIKWEVSAGYNFFTCHLTVILI
jgi:hypothetical protein